MDKITLEVRAGAGGNEAGIFALDLVRMYQRYAEQKGWMVDKKSNLLLTISGDNAFNELRYEAGVHRVQRIPTTEKRGRVHTSTASVAVLESQEVGKVVIKPEDLRIDTYRASGAGGQHVNKTSSAVRITHIPTGVVVARQDQRSQHQNKEKAMESLESKIMESSRRKFEESVSDERRSQIGTADRSEKIRTYNFPQNRLTDHRIGKSWQNLDRIMEGDLKKIIGSLMKREGVRKK